MTLKELQQWQFTEGKSDQWWIHADGEPEPEPMQLLEIVEAQRTSGWHEVRLLHESQANQENPAWIDFDWAGPPRMTAQTPTPIPQVAEPSAEDSSQNLSIGTVIFVLLCAAGWFAFTQNAEERLSEQIQDDAATEMRRIERSVAEDAVAEYRIAKRNGSALDAYGAASLVVAAYLQANDQHNYKKWKKVEDEEKARYESQ
jgi:hypothetical protein